MCTVDDLLSYLDLEESEEMTSRSSNEWDNVEEIGIIRELDLSL